MYNAFNFGLVSRSKLACLFQSLKLTIEAALWGIFSITTMVSLSLPTLVQWQKMCGDGWGWVWSLRGRE